MGVNIVGYCIDFFLDVAGDIGGVFIFIAKMIKAEQKFGKLVVNNQIAHGTFFHLGGKGDFVKNSVDGVLNFGFKTKNWARRFKNLEQFFKLFIIRMVGARRGKADDDAVTGRAGQIFGLMEYRWSVQNQIVGKDIISFALYETIGFWGK